MWYDQFNNFFLRNGVADFACRDVLGLRNSSVGLAGHCNVF